MSQQAFVLTVSRILQEQPRPMNPPLFIFKRCTLAAAHNAHILRSFNFDLNKVIRAQHPSQISYGSEFRPTATLKKLLSDHPLWSKLKDVLDNGASFSLEDIEDSARKLDLTFHMKRGNHKSLSKCSTFIEPVITEDVERGFVLPLPVEAIQFLSSTSLAPLGCHKQSTINERGDIIPKYRLTHSVKVELKKIPYQKSCTVLFYSGSSIT
jgi:hypothetical protein